MKKGLKNTVFTGVTTLCLLISNVALYAQQPRPAPVPYAAGIPVNFIRTWDAAAPEQDANAVMNRPLKDVKQATQYFDGLARPLQTVVKQGSMATGSSANDFVSAVEYDALGREQHKYLPFAANNTGGNTHISDGAFKMNPFQQQATFMTAQYGTQNETFFYSKTNFETSPLSRVTDNYAPGNSWVGSESNAEPQRRNVQAKYYYNTATDAVRIWTVADNNPVGQFDSYSTSANYPAGQLFKNVTVDEHKKQIIEFKDKEGKVILKKVQLTATADDGTGSGYTGWLSTYYIYDDLNNLRCVIQPEGVKALQGTWVLTTTLLNEQCFRYEYDSRNRMIMKKVPGAGELYMVYDDRDRLVMTQDANMRSTSKWLVTKYDALNRPLETGLWNSSTAFTTHLTAAATSTSYPVTTSGVYELLTLTHYDDYAGLPAGLSSAYLTTWNSNFSNTDNNNWPYPQMPVQTSNVKGLATWTQVKVLGTANTYIYSVSIYDEKARLIQVQSTNISNGIDVTTTQYTWAGQPLVTVQKQEKAGTNAQTHVVVTKTNYDDLGRILNIKKTVNSTINSITVNKPEQFIVKNEYNQLGQLKKKTLGNNNLENLNYDYNIRGWMLGANRDYAKDANNTNYFGFDLGYDKAANGLIGNQTYANPQFNGNIEGMVWKSRGDGEKRKYDFAYDAANRLMKADFSQYAGGIFDPNSLVNYKVRMGDATGTNVASAYDDNGNIKRMQQWGWKLTSSPQIDDLVYDYQAGSNKLAKVTDGVSGDNKLGDFKDGTNGTTDDYSFDANGNLISDENKDILSIEYNHLNLPQVISLRAPGNLPFGTRTITYVYDAGGNKLQKQVFEVTGLGANRNITTTYINGFVYDTKLTNAGGSPEPDDHTDVLQFIPQEEGRIRFKPAAGNIAASFQYDYMLKDHLGNVRMVLTEEQQQDIYPAATLEDDVYQGDMAIALESQYYNIVSSKIVLSSTVTGLPAYQNNNGITNNNPYSNTGANSKKIYKLDASSNNVQDKNGMGIVLKVMAGDVINIWGKSYHKMPAAGYTNSTNPLSVVDVMNMLAISPVAGVKGITGTQISQLPGFPTTVTQLLNNQPPQDPSRPRASINWVILDDQFKYVTGNFDMVAIASNTSGSYKDHNIQGIAIPKNGYIYVYCSNESQYPVYFDNLQVVHDRGPVLEETHYYPFGLTMAGISSKAAGGVENKIKYNGMELQSKEFSDGMGLEMYEYKYRFYDHQIGRFISQDRLADKYNYYSPYQFAGNEVPNAIDLDGLEPARVTTSSRVDHSFNKNERQEGNNIVSTPVDVVSQSYTKNYTFYNEDGTTLYTWTQTVTTTATISLDGSVSIAQNSSSYFDSPNDKAPAAKISGENSTPKLSEVSADLRNVVNSVVDYKKTNKESPLQKEARDNIATKENVRLAADVVGIGGSVPTAKAVLSSVKGGAITMMAAIVVAGATQVMNEQLPSNPENIIKTTNQKSTTSSYPNGVTISTPNPKELDHK